MMTSPADPVHCYSAVFEFLRDDKQVRTTDIDFTATNRSEAIRAAARFWDGRNKALPEHYHRLLCYKVYGKTIAEIGAAGEYRSMNGFNFFEYKVDTAGLPLADYIEYRCRELEQRKI